MSKFRKLPSQEFLQECFDYNHETGDLIWKERPLEHFVSEKVYNWWNKRFCGQPSYNLNPSGYLICMIYSKSYAAHRIIWKLMTGEDPEFEIDHINQIRSDNSWNNLRLAERNGNQQNKFNYKNNTTGVKGVRYSKEKNRFVAEIQANKVNHYIGTFESLDDAALHVELYRDKYHQEFSNYGDGATILKSEIDSYEGIDIEDGFYKHGSKTKIRGVTMTSKFLTKPYMARTTINGVRTYLGCFATIDEARIAIENVKHS
jgi:hypothetical protein